MITLNPIRARGLLISPFRAELLNERYVCWLNDSEVVRYSEQRHCAHTLQSCASYWSSIRSSGDLFLSIEVEGDSLVHIGNITVSVDAPNRSADLSILIGDKKCWGRGYATFAWCSVMNALFEEASLRRITAGTMQANEPMMPLIKRSGMEIDSIRARHFIWEDKEVALVQASRFS